MLYPSRVSRLILINSSGNGCPVGSYEITCKRIGTQTPFSLLVYSHLISHSISFSLQLLDVTEGLAYLHSCDVIHGNLKGVRVFTHYDASSVTDEYSQTS